MASKRFVVCIHNQGYEVSLELRKLYEVLPDSDAGQYDQIRLIDESGEDYLYPQSMFAVVELPSTTEQAVVAAA